MSDNLKTIKELANDLIEAAKDGMTVMNGMTSEDDEDF